MLFCLSVLCLSVLCQVASECVMLRLGVLCCVWVCCIALECCSSKTIVLAVACRVFVKQKSSSESQFEEIIILMPCFDVSHILATGCCCLYANSTLPLGRGKVGLVSPGSREQLPVEKIRSKIVIQSSLSKTDTFGTGLNFRLVEESRT